MSELDPSSQVPNNSNLVPSPLIAGQFKPHPHVTKDYCEKVAKELEGDAVMIIVFRKHDVPCEVENCDGYHAVGNDFGMTHPDAHRAVDLLTSVFGLEDCE